MIKYEVLAQIYRQRKNHKLDEWHTFCDWIRSLPYSELITGETTMTCKDCKNNEKCTNPNKSYKYNDGDSWANWCDDFSSIHESKSVKVNGLTIAQSGYNYHILVFDDDGMVAHMSCTREYSEDELISIGNRFIKK